MSLRVKLIILFLSVALIPLLFVSTLTFHNYKKSLETTCLSNLQNTAAFKADKIETYFAGLKGNIEIAQGFYNIKENLPVLIRLADDPNNPKAAASRKILSTQLQQMQSVSDMTDIMLVNPEGKIVYANKPGHYFKTMSTAFDTEQKAFTEGKNRVYFSDAYFDSAEDNRFEMLVTAPASDFNGTFIGVIAFEVDMATIYKVIEDVTGLGNTGEVLAGKKIGNQVIYINPLRHEPLSAIQKRITLGEKFGGPIQEAVQGKTGAGQSIDYRGKNVIAAWRYIPSLDWGLVAKIDTDEAFTEAIKLRNLAIFILAMVIVLSSITAFSISRSISEPIRKLSHGAEIVGGGNLDYKIQTHLNDEIGQLSRAFDKMTHDLKQTTASRDELNKEITERRQAEESLRESQEDLNRAQTVGNIGSWRLNIQINELTWSDQNHRIFGIPKGTPMTYETFLSTILPDDREFVDRKWQAALQGEHYDIEHRILVDDQIKWVRERAFLEFDPHGALLGGFGTSQDITERKKAEEAVAVSELRYRRLFEAARDGILILDADSGQIVNVNPFIKDMLGYSQEEFLDKKIWEIGLFKNIAATKEAFLELQNKDYIRYENLPFETKDGRRIAVEFVSNVYLVDRKRVFQCNIRDITDRVQAEEAVLVSEVRYRRLFEAARDGILILDADSGQIVNVNPFIKDMLGYSQEEFLDKKIWEIGLFKNIAASKEAFLELQNKDYIRYENLPFETKDGRRIAVEFVSNVYLVDRKRVFQCNIRDITDRIQAEESLRKSRDELEIRVKDRTKELAQTVSILENEVRERVLAENTVKIERKRFFDVLETLPVYVILLTEDYHVPFANRTFRERFGESDGKRCYEYLFNRTEPCEICETFKVLKTNQPQHWEWTGPDSRNYDIYDFPFTDTDGAHLIMEMGIDITEQKLAQGKQGVTNSLLELFVKKSLRKEYLDAVVEDIRNWSGCEFIGIRVRDNKENIPYESCVGFDDDFLATENALRLDCDNCVCIRAIMENPQKQEMNFMTAGGSFYCNDSTAYINGQSEQEKKGNRGACIKHGFQSIAVVPIRYRDEVMGVIHITDFKKDMASLSKIQFIEATIAPLVGEAIHRFTAESELEKYRLHLEELVRQRTHELEKANRQLYSEAIHRQQIADDLARSNKDLEQFAYVASHDLQEPLRAVSGFVELLKRNLQNSLDAKTTEYMNFTMDGTRRMHSLINGLLEYSRVSARGKNPQQTDSKTALDLAIAHLLAGIKESEAILTVDEMPKVHVDTVQLTQLFQNLIGNALKFRGEQPLRIHIGATRQGDAWRFAVTDNGIGIDPQYAERIFLIFQRLHTRQKYPGTGIGLAICKKIIERHGGKIWVESKPEEGSTFYFTIPDIGKSSQDG